MTSSDLYCQYWPLLFTENFRPLHKYAISARKIPNQLRVCFHRERPHHFSIISMSHGQLPKTEWGRDYLMRNIYPDHFGQFLSRRLGEEIINKRGYVCAANNYRQKKVACSELTRRRQKISDLEISAIRLSGEFLSDDTPPEFKE